MTLAEYIKMKRGNGARLAKKLKVHAPAVYLWAGGKRPIPVLQCVAIELATGKQVTRKEMRPKDWLQHWPELATHGGSFHE